MNNGLFARFWKNILLLIFRDSRSKTTDYRLQLLMIRCQRIFPPVGETRDANYINTTYT